MPTLKYRRMRGDMMEVFKIINDIYDPLTTVDMFELNTTSNTRGRSKKMKIKTSRLNVRKYTFVVRIVEIWNSLPESVIVTIDKIECIVNLRDVRSGVIP
jgi:hypothetical protein